MVELRENGKTFSEWIFDIILVVLLWVSTLKFISLSLIFIYKQQIIYLNVKD